MIPTYQQQQELVQKGLATVKTAGNLDTFKYSRKVMYDYLWDTDKNLLEVRGHTYDNLDGAIVQLPPSKTFNYLERGNWSNTSKTQLVQAFKKYNGYLAAATYYKGELIVSTTGTCTSDYATYAKEAIKNSSYINYIQAGQTAVFEIVTDWDKHIVEEQEGVYLLGTREHISSKWYPLGAYEINTLEHFLQEAKTAKTEGWMLYAIDAELQRTGKVCKLKTDYYIGKKKLMRQNKSAVQTMYKDDRHILCQLPERWKFAVPCILTNYTLESWLELTGLERRAILEEFEEKEKSNARS